MTEEDTLLLDTARASFAASTARTDAGGAWTDELRALGDDGWLGTVLHGDGAGPGATPVLVAEAAGAARLALPFAEVGVAVPAALATWPDGDAVLDAVVAGRARWPVAGVDAVVDGLRGRLPVRAVAVGNGIRVTGRADHVHAPDGADGFLVAAVADDGPVVLAVPAGPGVTVGADTVADEAVPTGSVTFDGVEVDAGTRLPDGALGRLVRWGAAASAAEMLGAAEALRDMTVAHARERHQFGVPIGSFQAVKHHCADMHVLVESLRVAVWAAGLHADAPEPGMDHVAVAKSRAQDATMEVGRLALQVHGGIGFTWEHPLHRYLKRIMRLQSAFGDARWHRAALAAAHVGPGGGRST